MAEQVNHPKHYNQHPNGVECIEVIRHYTCDIANALKYLWRAGLKPEMGKADADKEIEDLKKALWYINDYRVNVLPTQKCEVDTYYRIGMVIIPKVTGYEPQQICNGYQADVAKAMNALLYIGIIKGSMIYRAKDADEDLKQATLAIQQRIAAIEQSNNI